MLLIAQRLGVKMSKELMSMSNSPEEAGKVFSGSPVRRRRSRFSAAPPPGPGREELLSRLTARGVTDRVRRIVEEGLAKSDASRIAEVEAEARSIYASKYRADGPAPDPKEAFASVRESLKKGPAHDRFLEEVHRIMSGGGLLAKVLAEEIGLVRAEYAESQRLTRNTKESETGTVEAMAHSSLLGRAAPSKVVPDPANPTQSPDGPLTSTNAKPSLPPHGRASALKALVNAKTGPDTKITDFLNTLGLNKPAQSKRSGVVSNSKQGVAKQKKIRADTSKSKEQSECSAAVPVHGSSAAGKPTAVANIDAGIPRTATRGQSSTTPAASVGGENDAGGSVIDLPSSASAWPSERPSQWTCEKGDMSSLPQVENDRNVRDECARKSTFVSNEMSSSKMELMPVAPAAGYSTSDDDMHAKGIESSAEAKDVTECPSKFESATPERSPNMIRARADGGGLKPEGTTVTLPCHVVFCTEAESGGTTREISEEPGDSTGAKAVTSDCSTMKASLFPAGRGESEATHEQDGADIEDDSISPSAQPLRDFGEEVQPDMLPCSSAPDASMGNGELGIPEIRSEDKSSKSTVLKCCEAESGRMSKGVSDLGSVSLATSGVVEGDAAESRLEGGTAKTGAYVREVLVLPFAIEDSAPTDDENRLPSKGEKETTALRCLDGVPWDSKVEVLSPSRRNKLQESEAAGYMSEMLSDSERAKSVNVKGGSRDKCRKKSPLHASDDSTGDLKKSNEVQTSNDPKHGKQESTTSPTGKGDARTYDESNMGVREVCMSAVEKHGTPDDEVGNSNSNTKSAKRERERSASREDKTNMDDEGAVDLDEKSADFRSSIKPAVEKLITFDHGSGNRKDSAKSAKRKRRFSRGDKPAGEVNADVDDEEDVKVDGKGADKQDAFKSAVEKCSTSEHGVGNKNYRAKSGMHRRERSAGRDKPEGKAKTEMDDEEAFKVEEQSTEMQYVCKSPVEKRTTSGHRLEKRKGNAKSAKRRRDHIPSSEEKQTDVDDKEDVDVEGLDRIREVLEQIRRLPEAGPFLEPVDSSAPGCETYYAEIKEPRNLGTICGRLGLVDGTGYYKSVDAVVRDVNLVWSNCFQFNPSRDQICDYARICKTRFEILTERCNRGDSSTGGARKSSRSTQGVHKRLLTEDRSVAELRRKKRMKFNDPPVILYEKGKESTDRSFEASVLDTVSGPGAEVVGHSLLVFCGLNLPGIDSEAVRWHQCKVLEYNETDRTHNVLWCDFGKESRHISFGAGSDYCIFKDRGVMS